MNLDTLKEKKELVSGLLLVIAVLAAGLILVKVTGFFVTSARAGNAVKDAIKHSQPDEKNITVQSAKAKKVADALKKDSLFAPAAPKQNPVKAVAGIMGNEAIINGKLYQVGAKVGDAKIVAINPTSVVIEWDGKKKTFSPIDGNGSSGSSGSSRSGRSTSRSRPGSSKPGRPGMVVTKAAQPEARGIPGTGGMTREKMMSMSESDRNKFRMKMKGKYETMSESEKEKFRAKMREQFGGRPGGGDGRGRGGRSGGKQPVKLNVR